MDNFKDSMFLIESNLPRLNKSEYKFIKFCRIIERPLTEDQIINFYKSNVQRFTGETTYYNDDGSKTTIMRYNDSIIRNMSLQWFDRNLGKAIRKGLLKHLKIMKP